MLTEACPGNRLESLFQMEARDIERLHNLCQHLRHIPERDFGGNCLCRCWRGSGRRCYRGDRLREQDHLTGLVEAFDRANAVNDLHADAVNDFHMTKPSLVPVERVSRMVRAPVNLK